MLATAYSMRRCRRRDRRDSRVGRCLRLLGNNWKQPFRSRFESEMISKNDTHLFVGNLHQFPTSWIVVGLFYPPKLGMADLFD